MKKTHYTVSYKAYLFILIRCDFVQRNIMPLSMLSVCVCVCVCVGRRHCGMNKTVRIEMDTAQ